MSRILLLEDDLSLSDGLSFALQKQGWETDTARTLREAWEKFSSRDHDLLILDVSLPDGSGFDLCRRVRAESRVPILFLTASDEETSVVMGLDIGGDDYVTKPFKLGILMSRVNALLRRGGSTAERPALCSNGVRVVPEQGRAFKNDEPVDLTAAELRLLCLFMENPNVVLTRERVYERLWDCGGSFADENTLSVYVRRLRVKIEDDPEHPEKIVTVRGLGYKWSVTA